MLPVASASIFVSHTNDDALAKRVLDALQAAFAAAPQELQLVCDRDSIAVGQDWRLRIYEWLEHCPAAVLLISPDSFLREKPWVAREAFFLAVRRLVRGNVLIIPVTIGDVAERLKNEPEFEPARTREIEWVACPDPNDRAALAQVIERIRTALASVKPKPHVALSGLAQAIARVLGAHQDAHAALAAALESSNPHLNAEALAVRLLETDEKHMADAVKEFARYAASAPRGDGSDAALALRRLLSAREVPEGAARQLAVEMAKSPSEARAALINSTDKDVTKLYVVRAAERSDHGWSLLNANLVLELGFPDTARSAFAKALRTILPSSDRDGKNATAKATAVAKTLRRMARPAVFCLDISDVGDGAPLIEVVRSMAPHCGLLLRSESTLPSVDPWPAETICKLEPELDEIQWERLVGLSGALDRICMQPEQS